MHTERAQVTNPGFNEAMWIERLAAALEQVAAKAQPSYSPFHLRYPDSGQSASIGRPSIVDIAPSRRGRNTI